jgi:hypothetical protein
VTRFQDGRVRRARRPRHVLVANVNRRQPAQLGPGVRDLAIISIEHHLPHIGRDLAQVPRGIVGAAGRLAKSGAAPDRLADEDGARVHHSTGSHAATASAP